MCRHHNPLGLCSSDLPRGQTENYLHLSTNVKGIRKHSVNVLWGVPIDRRRTRVSIRPRERQDADS